MVHEKVAAGGPLPDDEGDDEAPVARLHLIPHVGRLRLNVQPMFRSTTLRARD